MQRQLFCTALLLGVTSCTQQVPQPPAVTTKPDVGRSPVPLPDGMIAIGLRIQPMMGFIDPGSEVTIYATSANSKDAPRVMVDRVQVLRVDMLQGMNDPTVLMIFAVTPEQARRLTDAVEGGHRFEVALLAPKS